MINLEQLNEALSEFGYTKPIQDYKALIKLRVNDEYSKLGPKKCIDKLIEDLHQNIGMIKTPSGIYQLKVVQYKHSGTENKKDGKKHPFIILKLEIENNNEY